MDLFTCGGGGVTGTREAIDSWNQEIEGGQGAIAPVDSASPVARRAVRRRPRRESQGKDAATLTAEEKACQAFERKTIAFGKYKGKKWGEVPVDFVRWFATFKFDRSADMRQLQVAVREYLDLKYGLRPGQLF